MCNCITLFFPGTYTAHKLTIDCFVKQAKRGSGILVPYPELWDPKSDIRKFRIPKKVSTFLFSPFNELICPMYTFRHVRYAIGLKKEGVLKELVKKMTPVAKLSEYEFEVKLRALDKKVTNLWGNVCKILVRYDTKFADAPTKALFDRYNTVAQSVLGYPVAAIKNTRSSIMANGWFHYAGGDKNRLFADIVTIEKKHKA